MNRPAAAVGLMVLVGPCLVGLGFEIGRSHDSTATTATTLTKTPPSNAGVKWWTEVKSQVEGIADAEAAAYSEWHILCQPDLNESECPDTLRYLTSLNSDCHAFNPGTLGATTDEVKALNELEAACEVDWLKPAGLSDSAFAAVELATANLRIGSSPN
jgi:hypothetical protein